jgi:DNA replication regulator SLD2
MVCDVLSGKIAPPKQNQTPRKRKREEEPVQVASKRMQTLSTPSKKTPARSSMKPWELDPYESPNVVRNLFTPSKKTAIGPTPQKDGQVLGLFDLLGMTPEKIQDLPASQIPVKATPRKVAGLGSTLKHSRTPASATKRRMLDMFATPRKDHILDDKGGNTPSSVSKLHFTTPSFLRRDSQRIKMPVVNEEDDHILLSPQMVRVPRKPLVRGLSSMLAGLRKMEEEALDDDLEALHEMENSNPKNSTSELKPAPNPKLTVPEDILVEDSQPGFPLGGFDSEGANDSEPEEQRGRDGLPLKVYKKKGQKRTTRAVKMKPTRSKPAPAPSTLPEECDDELAHEDEREDTVAESQIDNSCDLNNDEGRNFDSDSQSEYTASEGGTRYKRPDQSKKRKVMTKEGKIRTATRKVTSLASQNFKRLKLRNSGSKGGPAHNSRFRRKK